MTPPTTTAPAPWRFTHRVEAEARKPAGWRSHRAARSAATPVRPRLGQAGGGQPGGGYQLGDPVGLLGAGELDQLIEVVAGGLADPQDGGEVAHADRFRAVGSRLMMRSGWGSAKSLEERGDRLDLLQAQALRR
jgi:hypothetical protein